MKSIYVVTHTQSQHHVEGRVGGWYDTSLTDLGRQQAAQVADRLGALVGDRPAGLFSSDLKRAAETAQAIGLRLGGTPRLMKDLREISYGEAEGRPEAWVDTRQVPAPDDNRLDFRDSVAGRETRREAATRIYRAMEVIVEQARPGAGGGDPRLRPDAGDLRLDEAADRCRRLRQFPRARRQHHAPSPGRLLAQPRAGIAGRNRPSGGLMANQRPVMMPPSRGGRRGPAPLTAKVH